MEFTLIEPQFNEFAFRIKITAAGGEIYYTEDNIYEAICNEDSSGIVAPSIDPLTFEYTIHDDHPHFEIPAADTESDTCIIAKYTIHENSGDDTPSPYFYEEGVLQEDSNLVMFTLVEE